MSDRYGQKLLLFVCSVLLTLTSTACTGANSSDEPPPVIPGLGAEECAFTLKHVQRTDAHSSREEDWDGIQEDILKAEKYADRFWSRHWSECFPDVSYKAPASAGVYDEDDDLRCGDETVGSDNAFYCRDGKFVAYGSELMHRAVDEGDALAYLVVAHEWGHAIQDLLRGTEHAPLIAEQREQQADCLAGAALWGSDYEGDFEWQDGDTDEAIEALKSIADKSEWTKEGPDGASHGNALQRIGAFANGGSESGVANCFSMRPSEKSGPSAVTPSPTPRPSASRTNQELVDARGHDLTGWSSPSGNILCGAVAEKDAEPASVRCDVDEHRWKSPPRPADCRTGDWGHSVEVAGGVADFACAGDPATAAEPGSDDTWWWTRGDPTTDSGLAELPYGSSVRLSDSLVCSSERTGMSCRDEESGHGFTVSKDTDDIS